MIDMGQQAGYRPFPYVARRNLTQELLEVPLVVRAFGLGRGSRMLEVGCGRGVALPVLARLCAPQYLAGIDIDPDALADARRRLTDRGVVAGLMRADVRRLPFPADSFDVVIDFGTCYHISSPELALAEIARVLGSGGLFVYETPLSQLMSHPVRSFGRRLPWRLVPQFRRHKARLLWASRVLS